MGLLIRRIDGRRTRPSLSQFLEDAGLVLVLTATYDRAGKSIYTATVECEKGIRFYRVRGGDVGHISLIGCGVTEGGAIDNLRDDLSEDSIAESGWFKKTIHVPKLNRESNGIID